jgi:tetraacyldisaccharide 4'-kinase
LPRTWESFNLLSLALLPVTFCFYVISSARRQLFKLGILRTTKIDVPVIVVGNISVGGTGKTPTVIGIALELKKRGLNPGIISRGYRGDGITQQVTEKSTASQVGDEAILIQNHTFCPMWVGPNRVTSAQILCENYPGVNVIISDDGLQHYALKRDMEIIVIDGQRQFGNGLLLPSGPLRETKTRISECDAAVITGTQSMNLPIPTTNMTLVGDTFHQLSDPTLTCRARDFTTTQIAAIAGIGNPDRFFTHLASLGISAETKRFPDHHEFTQSDITSIEYDVILMTEKDAVKCKKMGGKNCWFLPVRAHFSGHLIRDIVETIKIYRG